MYLSTASRRIIGMIFLLERILTQILLLPRRRSNIFLTVTVMQVNHTPITYVCILDG